MKTKATNTAVILAAGRGSRRLPATRVVDKALLPIGNRPVIDYVIEQCAEADIENIVVVVSTKKGLIAQHYGNVVDIKQEYPWLGKDGEIYMKYVVQTGSSYGTAAALACTEPYIDREKFIVLPADGVIYDYKDSVIAQLLDTDEKMDGALAGLKVTAEEAKRHSLIEKQNNLLKCLIEKPTELNMTKEYEVNISYYLLPQHIFAYITQLQPIKGEYLLTDAVVNLANDWKIRVVPTTGIYMDAGEVQPWITANSKLRLGQG